MRASNFELLRIFSILLILILHTASLANVTDINSFNGVLIEVVTSFGEIGVSCFILISGYFGVKRNWSKVLQLIILVTGYSILVFGFNQALPDTQFSYLDLIRAILVVPLYNNWFIACYLIVLVLSPFLEVLVAALSKREYGKLLLTLFVCFSLLPTMFNTPYYTVLTAGGKCLTYFIFIYLLGRYIRLYFDRNLSKGKTLVLFCLSTVVINILNISASFLFKKQVFIYSMDCSPFILLSSLSVFFYFKSLVIRSKLINSVSSSIIAVYLLDDLRNFWDYLFFHINTYKSDYFLIVVILTMVVFSFIISVIIDKLRYFLFTKVEGKLIRFVMDKLNVLVVNFKLRILQ